jgi:hypothetical protein
MLSRMRPDRYGRITERAHDQLGLISWRNLRELDIRPDAFRRLPGWSARCPHVFANDAAPRSWRQDVTASLLCAPTGSVVTASTTARVLEVPGYERRRDIEILSHHGRSHRLCHGRLHQTFWLPTHHRACVDGIPTVAVRRLPFELAPSLRPSSLRWVIDFCINERGLTVETLALTVAELCRSGRPGSAEMRRQVDDLSPGYVPPNTVLAAKFRDLCVAHGLPAGDVEAHLGDDRWIGRVDVLYRAEKVIFELDSRRWHNTRDGFESDRERTNALVLAGWRVIRITWRMLHDHPERVAAIIRRALLGA